MDLDLSRPAWFVPDRFLKKPRTLDGLGGVLSEEPEVDCVDEM